MIVILTLFELALPISLKLGLVWFELLVKDFEVARDMKRMRWVLLFRFVVKINLKLGWVRTGGETKVPKPSTALSVLESRDRSRKTPSHTFNTFHHFKDDVKEHRQS